MKLTAIALPYHKEYLVSLSYTELKAIFKALVPDCRKWLTRKDMREYIQLAQKIDRNSLKVCRFILDKLVGWVQAIYKKSEPKPVVKPQSKIEEVPLHAYIEFSEIPEGFTISRNLSGLAMDLDVDYSVRVRQSVGELLIGRIVEQGRGIQAIPAKKGKPAVHFSSTRQAILYLAEQAKVKPYLAEPLTEPVPQSTLEIVLPFEQRRKSPNSCPLYKGDKVEVVTERKSKEEYDGEVATVRATTQIGDDTNVLVEIGKDVVLLERFECYLIGATQLLIA